VRATLEDAAGNETKLYEGSIDVISDPAHRAFDIGGIAGLANPLGDRPGLVVNGVNGGPDTQLSAYLVKGRRKRRRVARATVRWPSRHRAVVRLRSGRRPVTGALVTVAERRPGTPWTAVATATTSRTGQVVYKPRAGPSRDVRFVYFATSESLNFLDSRTLRARVAPRVRLGAAPRRLRNGQLVTFRGRVQGPPRPAAGLLLAIQAQAGPRRWITFRVTRADAASGRFQARYRFASTRGTIRYRFRAVVRTQSGYGYAPGHSRATGVAVSG
jgi:hypothetical protein